MLKKSMVNKQPPNVKDASGGGGKAPKMAPKINADAGGRRVILTEAKGGGKRASTFTAPRVAASSDAIAQGYTKIKG